MVLKTAHARAPRQVRYPTVLGPLLRFNPQGGEDGTGDVEMDELFFLNAGSMQRLSYTDIAPAMPMGEAWAPMRPLKTLESIPATDSGGPRRF